MPSACPRSGESVGILALFVCSQLAWAASASNAIPAGRHLSTPRSRDQDVGFRVHPAFIVDRLVVEPEQMEQSVGNEKT